MEYTAFGVTFKVAFTVPPKPPSAPPDDPPAHPATSTVMVVTPAGTVNEYEPAVVQFLTSGKATA